MTIKIPYTLDITQLEEPLEVILNVTYFHNSKPTRSSRDSDMDYYGYYEVEFNILYKDGSPAPELDAMLTAAEEDDIKLAIYEEMCEEA